MKVVVEFFTDCRGIVESYNTEVLNFKSDRQFVESCLLIQFNGDVDELLEYWDEYCDLKSVEDVVEEVIASREGNIFWLSEEAFCKIIN